MKKLEGFPLFSTATAVILDEMAQCHRTTFTHEEWMVTGIYNHYVVYGCQPVWVRGWARVARHMIGQEACPIKKNRHRIRKDIANDARVNAKYGPRQTVRAIVDEWLSEFDD